MSRYRSPVFYGGVPACIDCGAIGHGNASCPTCVLHWDWMPYDQRKPLIEALKAGEPGKPLGTTADAVFLLRLKQHRAFEALERLVGRDWEQKLRLARAEDEWRHEWELRDYLAAEYRKERWQGLLSTLRERAKCEDNYSLNRVQRWAYTAKAAICIVFGIEFRPKPAHAITFHYRDSDDGDRENTVTVYADGYDAKTARRIAMHRSPIIWNWPSMTREKAISEAKSRFFLEDGWRIDFIDTGTIDSHGSGYGGSWSATWMSVPGGWRRWGYHVHSDGESSY